MNISTPQASFLSNIGRFPSSYIGSANDGMGLGGLLPALVNIILLGKMSEKQKMESNLFSECNHVLLLYFIFTSSYFQS